ncbi:hypothetical protein GCM10010363_08850 [Streptomyces omiyaensis]|uniref:hypothetical protein n=1 Tax=Streptomyces omiyaensis TaxID=68247 RepID=UPI001677ADD0|nr:hypothetical protein [Streptomyces omiyaensis]GGY30518.1 hypothetical protein GCM10010363_08850 [Streptomyces omiyaensis]
MSSMIDVIPIVKDHLKTLRSHRDNRILWKQVAFFYGTPLALGALSVWLSWKISGVGNILAAFAILAGLLFNLLVLLFDIASKAAQAGGLGDDNTRLKLAKQLQANVTYALLLALLCSGILGVASGMGMEKVNRWLSGVLMIFLAHFSLTLLMIVRRIRSAFLSSLNIQT